MPRRSAALLGLACCLTGCTTTEPVAQGPVAAPAPNYSRALPPGDSALRRVTDPSRLPDLAEAYRNSDDLLTQAIDRSLDWYSAPSSRRFFPFEGITHEQARNSLLAIRELLSSGLTAEAFAAEVTRQFDVYESVGYDSNGTVLFTGYYAPVFAASRYPSRRFAYPLYERPDDLATDPDGRPLGQRLADGAVVPYLTRREIESSGALAGTELVWLEDPLSVYIVHVNGSAKLRLAVAGAEDTEIMYVGYAGKTDHPYTGLGKLMIEEGLLEADGLSLAAIRREFRRNPKQVVELINRNDSYVFFTQYDGGTWPAGSLGVAVTTQRTLATDKRIYPRGGLVLVNTKAVTYGGGQREFLQFMLDQDTGGAIQAPGRADIFMGIGSSAEILAGGQYAEGRLYYFFLKTH